MSIISQLEFQVNFSQSEKALAQYILQNRKQALNLNAKELAKNTYTSPATVVRFCQKLGLKGYSDFRIKYLSELNHELSIKDPIDVNFPFKQEDDLFKLCNNMQQLYNEVVEDTLRLIQLDNLEKITDLLINSNIIYIFGAGNSVFSALDFENKMSRIGVPIQIKIIESEQLISVYNATERDAAIFISYTGETENVINMAQLAKQKNVPIIAITSIGNNTLSFLADYVIHTNSRENVCNKIATFASKLSTDFILDILFSSYFSRNYNKNFEYKISSQKGFDKRKSKSPIADS